MLQYHQPPMRWLQILIVIILLLGILFRFVNLDQKPYWHDETYTSLRISGYTVAEAGQQLYTGQPMSRSELLKYQSISPAKGVLDTIQGLAKEEPQHPLLYYAIARLWTQFFGSTPSAIRSLSALISLAGLPLIYWLGWELFGSPAVGGMAVVLYAVSPLFVRFAQEGRQYGLWLVLIMLSSIALLRALRRKTHLSWGFYGLSVAVGLYCHLLSSLVILGHGFYVAAIPCGTAQPNARFRLTHPLKAYLLASLSGCLLFMPWLWITYCNRESLLTANWLKQPLPFCSLLRIWSFNLFHAFFTGGTNSDQFWVPLVLPLILLLGISIYGLCQQTPQRVWLFVLVLMGAIALPFLLLDIMQGGRRTVSDRYLLPSYLGIYLAVAYLLATQMLQLCNSTLQVKTGRAITGVLISGSILACAINAQALTWWGWSEFDVAVSRIINQTTSPFVITDAPFGVIMPLAHRLHPDAQFLLLNPSTPLQIANRDREMFVYNSSDRLHTQLKKQGTVPKLIYQFREHSLVVSLHQVSPTSL